MLANRGDKRFSVAREVRVAPRDNTHLHVLFNFKGNRDDVFAVELVRDHARAHGVAIEAYEQVEQGGTVAHADVLVATQRGERFL